VDVTAPRVDDRRDGHRFSSAILPPYMRRSPKVTEVLPVLYLRGCRPTTSHRRWRGSSARPRGCRLRRSNG
jgi:hypothetical protein